MNLVLHLTHDCQLRCVYCYAGAKRSASMSWDVERRAIDLFFARPATDPPSTIVFFGGEPLLELPLLERCVAHVETLCRETGRPCRLAITTNGLALDEGVVDYLAEKGVEPMLSFDGVPESQDICRPYRDGRPSFEDTRRVLPLLLARFPRLTVCAVVTPQSVRHLRRSIDFLLESGVRSLLLNPNFYAQWSEEDLHDWRAGYEHAGARYVEEFRAGRPFHVSFITAKILTHLRGGYAPCERCEFGEGEIAVAPSGNIYPCQRTVAEDVEERARIGDVFRGIDRDACRRLSAQKTITNPECLGCALSRRCRNWCSCVNRRLTGRFDRAGALVCHHERMAIEIADRAASTLYEERNGTFMETFYLEGAVLPEWV